MYTTPPTKGFLILSLICLLLLCTIPLMALAVYQQPEVTSPPADTVGDAKINEQNNTLDTNVPEN